MQLLSFFFFTLFILLFLIAYAVYVKYLPFSATKVSGRRREETRGDGLLHAAQRSYALT